VPVSCSFVGDCAYVCSCVCVFLIWRVCGTRLSSIFIFQAERGACWIWSGTQLSWPWVQWGLLLSFALVLPVLPLLVLLSLSLSRALSCWSAHPLCSWLTCFSLRHKAAFSYQFLNLLFCAYFSGVILCAIWTHLVWCSWRRDETWRCFLWTLLPSRCTSQTLVSSLACIMIRKQAAHAHDVGVWILLPACLSVSNLSSSLYVSVLPQYTGSNIDGNYQSQTTHTLSWPVSRTTTEGGRPASDWWHPFCVILFVHVCHILSVYLTRDSLPFLDLGKGERVWTSNVMTLTLQIAAVSWVWCGIWAQEATCTRARGKRKRRRGRRAKEVYIHENKS